MGNDCPDTASHDADPPLVVGRAGRAVIIGEREVACRTLERLFGQRGYEVSSADAREALSCEVMKLAGEVDVVVLDVGQQFDTTWVVGRIREACPCARVVLCSTPDAAKGIGAALCAGALAVIMKPFDPRQLADLIRMAMERQPRNDRCRRVAAGGDV